MREKEKGPSLPSPPSQPSSPTRPTRPAPLPVLGQLGPAAPPSACPRPSLCPMAQRAVQPTSLAPHPRPPARPSRRARAAQSLPRVPSPVRASRARRSPCLLDLARPHSPARPLARGPGSSKPRQPSVPVACALAHALAQPSLARLPAQPHARRPLAPPAACQQPVARDHDALRAASAFPAADYAHVAGTRGCS
jgi:hypothetical protein